MVIYYTQCLQYIAFSLTFIYRRLCPIMTLSASSFFYASAYYSFVAMIPWCPATDIVYNVLLSQEIILCVCDFVHKKMNEFLEVRWIIARYWQL